MKPLERFIKYDRTITTIRYGRSLSYEKKLKKEGRL